MVEHIEARGILPPVMVLQLLAASSQLQASAQWMDACYALHTAHFAAQLAEMPSSCSRSYTADMCNVLSRAQVSCLRDYVGRHLAREAAEAARDREAASRLAADSAALREELSRLQSQASNEALHCLRSVCSQRMHGSHAHTHFGWMVGWRAGPTYACTAGSGVHCQSLCRYGHAAGTAGGAFHVRPRIQPARLGRQ